MLHPSARVLSAACLLAALAAAQAPASPDTPQPIHAVAAPDWLAASGSGLRTALLADRRAQEQDPDYSLRGMFQSAHGDFMMRRERYNPQVELTGQWLPTVRVGDEPGSFDLLRYSLDSEFAFPVSADGYLIGGAFYNARDYATSDDFAITDETLVNTGVTVGFGAFLDETMLFEFKVRPGIWSDMDGTLHHKDFDFPGEATLTIRTLDEFFWKVGARYNQTYEDAPWLPILGFSWEIGDGFRLDILLPDRAEASYWFADGTGFLIGAEATGGQYHVRTTEAQGNQRADVQVQEIIAYAGLMHRMNDNLSFFGRLGAVLAGDYDLTSGAAGFDHIEGALQQGLFAEIGFGIDF